MTTPQFYSLVIWLVTDAWHEGRTVDRSSNSGFREALADTLCLWWQVAVDLSTAPEVFDAVRAELRVWFKTNAGEYSGNFLCVANFAGDPLKYTLCVWWEYSHSGEQL